MLFRLCNNGKGILLTREFKIITDFLVLEIPERDELHTAVIKIGEKTYYRTFEDGKAELSKEFIQTGVITINIIKNEQIQPTWVCDELYAERNGDVVVVGANTLQFDNLLNELRVENDVCREKISELEEMIGELSRHYDEIYAGYEIL